MLPDRAFDLPSLRNMDADVRIDLDRLELGHPRLQDMRRVGAHLTLDNAVLAIDDIDATLARGRVTGHVRLDGREPRARWDVDLTGRGLRIEDWIAQPRPEGQPPYAAGRLAGRVQLKGQGRSTAELLATSDGRMWALWTRGRISHLAVEFTGIDVAQALGLMVVGDDALPVHCGAADLAVKDGRVTPNVMVIDTRDSTIVVDGGVSLVDERLDLRARVEPKDFSPLALRAPLYVRGTFDDPSVSIDKERLARRLVPSALLALVHPLAALLPLIDKGDDEAEPAVAECRQVAARFGGTKG